MGLPSFTKQRRQETDVVRKIGLWMVIGSAEEEENWRQLSNVKKVRHLKLVS